MKLWETIRKFWSNLKNWYLDSWRFAERGEKIFHVVGKDFSFSGGPMIQLLEARSRKWIRVEGEVFNEITPRKSALRVLYEQTRIRHRFRVLQKTVINPTAK